MPFGEIVENRDVALVYSAPAWRAVEGKLHLPITWRAEPREATTESWDRLQAGLRGDVIYAVGGGLAVDAAKYFAAQKGLPLVCLPTALSVDAFLTWASGIREEGCVRYIATTAPDMLIADLEVIAAGPGSIRSAGICDVLSIATGCWDWKFAAGRAKNPPGMAYIPYIDQAAAAILQGALDCSEAAGRGDPEGLKQLLDCIALEVQLTNQIGHSRPEEGSEHYFAYAVENETGPGWSHADLLGPGILLMLAAQGQDIRLVREALKDTHIPRNRIPEAAIRKVLYALPEYCQKHELPYSIAHELTRVQVDQIDIPKILA